MFGPYIKKAILTYRLASYFNCKGLNTISKYFFYRLSKDYGIHIHKKAKIGIGLKLPHPVAIVIGSGVIVGKNATIYQNVTLGGARIGDWKNNNYPKIGDNTVIFSGASVVGDIVVGNSCIIGSNAVVNKSFDDYSTIAGVPAKTIGSVSKI